MIGFKEEVRDVICIFLLMTLLLKSKEDGLILKKRRKDITGHSNLFLNKKVDLLIFIQISEELLS